MLIWFEINFKLVDYIICLIHYRSNSTNSINGAEIEVGQENLYEDPCQDWLDLINKKLTSPNYPGYYDPNTFCKWNLRTDETNYISLDFEHIHVGEIDNEFKCYKALAF